MMESRRNFISKLFKVTTSILFSGYVISRSDSHSSTYYAKKYNYCDVSIRENCNESLNVPIAHGIDLSASHKEFLWKNPIRDGDQARNVAMITYDDWGDDEQLSTILDSYRKHEQSKATFFFLGSQLASCAKWIERLAADGHLIGCHGWDHVRMDSLSTKEIDQSFGQFTHTLRTIIPGYQLHYFRMPYGGCRDKNRNCEICKIAADWGLQHVYWSFFTDGRKPVVRKIVMNNLQKGSIILCHMNYQYDIQNTDWLLTYLERRGFSAETVETGLSKKHYWGI